MATLLELAKIKHHAVRSDGAKFLDGERDDSLPTPWLTVSSGRVTLQKGLYDELLVVKGEVTDDQIKAWAAMGSPFYDAAGNIVYEGAGGRIEMDKDGQRFIRSADGQTMIEMDTETGSAHFKGDITGASGTFSGSLSAEKIIEGIEVYGGLTADHIKGGTISYDKLNVEYAKVTSVSMLGSIGGGSTAQLIQSATSQNDRNIIRLNLKAGDEPLILISHNSLRLIAGIPLVFASWSGYSVDLGFPINPIALGDSTARWTIAVEGVYANHTLYQFEERYGGGDLTIDLLFQRHAIS